MFRKIVEQSIENGFFDEVTEDVLNDEEQFNTMVEVFLDEIIFSKRSLVLCEYSAKNTNLTVHQQDVYVG